MSELGVVLFYTTSSAIQAEKVVVKEGLACKLIPTPRQLSSDCGISLRFSWENRGEIESAFKKTDIEFDAIYHL